MKDPWRSWQENERSLKILARKWRILEDLNKNFEDPHEDPQEDPQRSSWRSCKILKDPWKIFTRGEHTWWSNKPVKAEFPIPLDTTCLFLRVGGFWPVFRHSKNPTSAKIYTTHSLYYRIKFRQTYTPLAPSASLVLTFHMDWTSDQKQAFWNCNDEEQSLISNSLEDTVHL